MRAGVAEINITPAPGRSRAVCPTPSPARVLPGLKAKPVGLIQSASTGQITWPKASFNQILSLTTIDF